MPGMPSRIEPMRAVSGEVPTSSDGWAFEVKWDGVRAISFIADGQVRLQSSNVLDITVRWPELQPLAAELDGHAAVLDGEIVTFNDEGHPDFGLLQRRMHVGSAKLAGEWAAQQPAVLVVFDLLWFDGHDAISLGYEQRRRLLVDLVEPGPNWQVPDSLRGDGQELLQAVTDQGMEGLMAKRLDAPYEPGRRSASWRKLKIRKRQELVVGGWSPGVRGRAGTIGALLVGYYDDEDRFVFAGKVGSGLGHDELARWQRELDAITIEHSPFVNEVPRAVAGVATYVEPRFVVEVAFSNWSLDGQLRHPSYVGWRDDKEPRDVRREA